MTVAATGFLTKTILSLGLPSALVRLEAATEHSGLDIGLEPSGPEPFPAAVHLVLKSLDGATEFDRNVPVLGDRVIIEPLNPGRFLVELVIGGSYQPLHFAADLRANEMTLLELSPDPR